jgi:hypothetical protein
MGRERATLTGGSPSRGVWLFRVTCFLRVIRALCTRFSRYLHTKLYGAGIRREDKLVLRFLGTYGGRTEAGRFLKTYYGDANATRRTCARPVEVLRDPDAELLIFCMRVGWFVLVFG